MLYGHPVNFVRGMYIWRLRWEGGGGTSKADVVREVAWILYYKSDPNADKGGRGSKILKILQTSYVHGPLWILLSHLADMILHHATPKWVPYWLYHSMPSGTFYHICRSILNSYVGNGSLFLLELLSLGKWQQEKEVLFVFSWVPVIIYISCIA